MKLDPETLQQVVSRTLDHYHARAAAFWEGTRHHDVTQNIEALLRTFPSATYTAQPCYVLAPQFPKVLLKASCNGQLKPTKIGAEWQ